MDTAEVERRMATLSPQARAVFELMLAVEMLCARLREANESPLLRSRELSLAITNIEQGEHWLSALGARFSESA